MLPTPDQAHDKDIKLNTFRNKLMDKVSEYSVFSVSDSTTDLTKAESEFSINSLNSTVDKDMFYGSRHKMNRTNASSINPSSSRFEDTTDLDDLDDLNMEIEQPKLLENKYIKKDSRIYMRKSLKSLDLDKMKKEEQKETSQTRATKEKENSNFNKSNVDKLKVKRNDSISGLKKNSNIINTHAKNNN
eukprot:CAMPEP_0116926244 /NCGR_PEP_ID=MMETSP0467-20121206/24607_1 /TAXON_ID=283647 /ORGANISM="Mesodinium pulex, Strain SPMC105" /LENGTH=187 /DNA_ID=CAMNT_0004605459 /DNA_START=390 /DNA_END=953 /DNA_ORIENTATION=+